MKYGEIFELAKNRLKELGATIKMEDLDLPLEDMERKYYTENENFSIPDDFFELFNIINGLTYFWELAQSNNSIFSGFILLPNFLNFMENKTQDKLWADWYEKEDIEEMKKHRILEVIHGDDAYITVKFEKDGSYNLYFVDGNCINFGGSKKLPKIPLNLKQYIDTIFNYFGIQQLRYHLHKHDFYTTPEKYIPQLEEFKNLSKN